MRRSGTVVELAGRANQRAAAHAKITASVGGATEAPPPALWTWGGLRIGQEQAMRATVLGGIALSILIGGAAGAQQSQGDPGQQQRHDQMLQTTPGKNGKEEPSAHVPNTSNGVFVNGSLAVP